MKMSGPLSVLLTRRSLNVRHASVGQQAEWEALNAIIKRKVLPVKIFELQTSSPFQN